MGCGIMWGGHFISQASWQKLVRDHNMAQSNLGFLAKWLLFPPEFWMWQQFNSFPLLSHIAACHLRKVILRHKEGVRWPPSPPVLDVSEGVLRRGSSVQQSAFALRRKRTAMYSSVALTPSVAPPPPVSAGSCSVRRRHCTEMSWSNRLRAGLWRRHVPRPRIPLAPASVLSQEEV